MSPRRPEIPWLAVFCGSCGRDIPDGTGHVVVHAHSAGSHALYCGACCPCVTTPTAVVPHGMSL